MDALKEILDDIKKSILDGSIKYARFHQCEFCNDSGWMQTWRTEPNGRQYSGVIRCESCDYWERRKRLREAA